VMGVRIISSKKVWVGGRFTWESPVFIDQHGVRVERFHEGTRIEFPSGTIREVKGEDWQEIIDDHA